MTAAIRPRLAYLTPGLRLVAIATTPGIDTAADRRLAAYWRSGMLRLEVALAVDTPRVLKLFATRVLI